MKTINGRKFHEQADGSLVCEHRDVTCCGDCIDASEDVVDVYGAAFHMTAGEWVAMIRKEERLARRALRARAKRVSGASRG